MSKGGSVDQSAIGRPVSSTELRESAYQTWISNDENTSVTLSICIFDSEEEAIRGTHYYTGTTAGPWLWGTIFDGIVGSHSWRSFNNDKAVLFAYGNIEIQISRHKEDDLKVIPLLANAQMEKIKQSLDPQIIQDRETLKASQLSGGEYNHHLTEKLNINLNGYTRISNDDSLWLMKDEGLVMGIRREWQDDEGEVVGVDICKLESNALAAEVASERESMTHDWLVTGIGAISWEGDWSSDVLVFGNIVIHYYSFKSQKTSQDTTNKSVSLSYSFPYFYNPMDLRQNNYSPYLLNFSGFNNNIFNDVFLRYPYGMNLYNSYNSNSYPWGDFGFFNYNTLNFSDPFSYLYQNFGLDYPFYIR